jgi:hypothetical protein
MQSNMQENHLTMHKTVPATVTIHFIDGTTQCFGFEAPEIDPPDFCLHSTGSV